MARRPVTAAVKAASRRNINKAHIHRIRQRQFPVNRRVARVRRK